MSTNIHSIATELKSIYLKEPCRNSEIAENIKLIIDRVENERNIDGIDKDEAILDFFEKRIQRTVEAFTKNTTELNIGKTIDSSYILPKPSFDILKYDKRACVDFLVAYFEESDCLSEKDDKKVSNRKAKYLYDYKVDLDKKYDFIYKVLGHSFFKPASLVKINDNFNRMYCEVRLWIFDKAQEYLESNNINYPPESKLYMWYEKIMDNEEYNYTRYIILLALIWLAICNGIKSNMLFKDMPWAEKGKFRLLWKLWMWTWMQTIQYLLLEKIEKIDDESLNRLKARMEELEKEIDDEKISMNKSNEIFPGYFMYNFLLIVRDETIKDLQLQQSLSTKGNKHFNIPDELCFMQSGNRPKEWVKNINEADKQKYFNFGDKKCSTQTFKSRISFCKEFVEAYNCRTMRQLDFNDLKTQRAVYRAFYVDKIKINRRDLSTIAKNIISKNSYEGIFTEHDLLGNVISSEVLTEYYQGERILKIKNDFISLIYSIGLKVFYKYFPCFEKNEKNFLESLDKLEFYFTETIVAIYESFYKE